LDHRTNSIFELHKIYIFLDYISKTLQLDENILKDKLYIHRIKNGYTFREVAKRIGFSIDKSTVVHFEQGGKSKE
jgi:hypothetical protein